MENPEEILHSLEEFTKTKPKDIPRELEEYLCFVAKTGDPVYQWSAIKSLFREKMVSVITEFYETCPSLEIPPCPNVDLFNYDVTKNFILEKLDTFGAAPFTVQRICELLTTPRKEYNRIDKYMRALEKNILVVSTTEPGGRRNTENGEGIVNGLESEHLPETSNSSNDINVEEMDDAPSWPRLLQNENVSYQNDSSTNDTQPASQLVQETVVTASKISDVACTSSQDTVITCRSSEEPYVSIEPVPSNTCTRQDNPDETDVSVTITAIPAGVQKRRSSVEPVVSSESTEEITNSSTNENESPNKNCEETSKEIDAKAEKQETSSSQQIEDADSSSSLEEEQENVENQEEKSPDASSTDEAIPKNQLSSTEEEEEKASNEVDTTEVTPSDEQSKAEVSEEVTVDTTKCSHVTPQEPSIESTPTEDLEISSSDKVEDEVDSSEGTEAESERVDESLNEANSSSGEAESDKVEESQEVEHVEVEDNSATPMEVDEDCSNSESVEEVVRAEATSDSSL